MDDAGRFNPNPDARISVRAMGREGHPLLIVDDAFLSPETLVAAAVRAPFAPPPHTQYPGLNAPLPATYPQDLIHALRPMLAQAFGIPAHLPLTAFGFLALATQGPGDLQPVQKVPHQDSTDPFRIATVHYLCRGDYGGTAFFRHKETGFESADTGRRAAYVDAVSRELSEHGARLDRHTDADTPGYDMIDHVDAIFNRLIVYRSHVLHAGLLGMAELSADPAVGRLTANCFIDVARP